MALYNRVMAKKSIRSVLVSLLLVAVAAVAWYEENSKAAPQKSSLPRERQGSYEVYEACRLVEDRGNDGDSFRVRFPDGREEIIRLGFVDAPESAFKTYGGGRNNHERIAHQARAFGSIRTEQAVKIGQDAKIYAEQVLGKSSFTIYTKWEDPYGDRRYRAFVELENQGEKRFFHELLVERGLARIYTQGAELPDGTLEKDHKDYLFGLQRVAQSKKQGGWGF